MQVDLPIDKAVVLLDIGFVDSNRGFILGTRQTLLETQDGGKTWEKREVPNLDEGINYRFTSITFNGEDGWIVGYVSPHSLDERMAGPLCFPHFTL